MWHRGIKRWHEENHKERKYFKEKKKRPGGTEIKKTMVLERKPSTTEELPVSSCIRYVLLVQEAGIRILVGDTNNQYRPVMFKGTILCVAMRHYYIFFTMKPCIDTVLSVRCESETKRNKLPVKLTPASLFVCVRVRTQQLATRLDPYVQWMLREGKSIYFYFYTSVFAYP